MYFQGVLSEDSSQQVTRLEDGIRNTTETSASIPLHSVNIQKRFYPEGYDRVVSLKSKRFINNILETNYDSNPI